MRSKAASLPQSIVSWQFNTSTEGWSAQGFSPLRVESGNLVTASLGTGVLPSLSYRGNISLPKGLRMFMIRMRVPKSPLISDDLLDGQLQMYEGAKKTTLSFSAVTDGSFHDIQVNFPDNLSLRDIALTRISLEFPELVRRRDVSISIDSIQFALIVPLLLTPLPTRGVTGACIRGGCSGELCVSPDSPILDTICVFREEYACYQNATCERQPDDSCGWTPTADLSACLSTSQ